MPRKTEMKKYVALTLLLLTTFFWGVTFTVVKDAVTQVDVFVFLAHRFALASLLLLLFCVLTRRRLTRSTLRDGIALGTVLFSAFGFQTVALLYTSASNTGFLTGLNVVLVPLTGALFFRQRVSASVVTGVGLAVAGLFLLSTNGTWSFNYGDILAAICAICVALHLLLTSSFSRRSGADIYWLTTVQICTVALLSFATAGIRGKEILTLYPQITWAIIICALFATVFAFLVQTAMQRVLSPSHTALIFCMEPVFAALYAYLAAGERMGTIGMVGAMLIFAGMVVSELAPRRAAAGAIPLPSGADTLETRTSA